MDRKHDKRVLGLVGSPRRGGNTETMVKEALRGAEEAGALVEKIILSELDIAPCDGCNACKSTGECTTADDMGKLLEKLGRSDVWVLGSPVYWWGPTAQFKLFLDRWYSKVHRPQDKAMFRDRCVILVIPMGDDDPATARHTVGILVDALDHVKAELFRVVLAPGVDDLGEVRQHSDVLAEARLAGMEAVTEP